MSLLVKAFMNKSDEVDKAASRVTQETTDKSTKHIPEIAQKVRTLSDLAYYGLIMVLIMGLICYFDERIPEVVSNIVMFLLPVIAFCMTATVVLFMKNNANVE